MAFVDLSSLPFQFEILFGGAICAVIVGWFVIAILIAVWVYRDANSRGMSGALWVIIVFFLGLIGLIVYLIVRSDRPVGMPPGYPGYGGYAQPGYPPPGYPPQAPPPAAPPPAAAATTCRNCGAPLSPGAGFCASCGSRV